MGGTGGPMDPRAGAQAGLTGAGLLAAGEVRPQLALGVENAPQPSTTQLAGRTTPSEIPIPTSASDTPAAAAVDAPAPVAAATTPTVPTAPTFQLAGSSNLGFPSVDMPLGEVHHVPFGTPAPTVSAPVVSAAAPTVSAAAAAPAQGPMRQIWPPSGGGTTAAWLAANPNWQADFARAEQRADGSWWVPTAADAPSPGPKYFNGTGDVIYQGSPAPGGV